MAMIGATDLDADPAPTLAITTTGTVYLRMEHTNGVVDAGTAVLLNAASTPANDATYMYVTVHHVVKTGTSPDIVFNWTASRTTHLWVSICDGELRVRRA